MEENQSRNSNAPVSTNNEVPEKCSRPITENHPLNNVVILDNIIRHLKYEDVKNLRLVCQRWKEVTKNVFWKFSKIQVCGNDNELTDNELEERALELAEGNQMLTDNFESTFPSPAGLPANTIVFDGCISRHALEYFWKERGSTTLTSVYFQTFCEPTKQCIDLNPYITQNLTTLDIDPSLRNNFTVSLKLLSNILNLKLFKCEILLDGKIVPRELDLHSCSVTYEGKQFKSGDHQNRNEQRILINDFVDFSKIKKLVLAGDFWKLDVGSCTTELEHLALTRIELIDLDSSQWKTNLVDFEDCICIGDRMEIKTIPGIDNIDFVGVIEIESLPKNLEHLWLNISMLLFSLPQPLIFEYPKLTSLTILYVELELLILPILDFTNCTSLVDFQISYRNSSDMYQIDFNRIKLPNSIRNVKLSNVITNIDVPWQLDTLVLYNYPLSAVEGALRHFTTTKLVIEFDPDLGCKEDLMIIINHWRNSSIEQLAVGYLLDDELQGCFLFTNKNGNGKWERIYWDRFRKLSNLYLHKDLLPFMISF